MGRDAQRRAVPSVVDDRSSSISYQGSWTPSTDSQGYDGTVTGTTEIGATMSYTFTGSAIQVYGERIPADHINATFVLDGATTWYTKPNAIGLQQHQVLFFSASGLESTSHTLVATNFGESLLIDYLEVTIDGSVASVTTSAQANPTTSTTNNAPSTSQSQVSPTTTTSQAHSPSTSASASSQSALAGPSSQQETSATVGGSATETPSSSTSDAASQQTGSSSGAVVSSRSGLSGGAYAGIVIGVVALLLALLAFFLLRRRRAKMAAMSTPHDGTRFEMLPQNEKGVESRLKSLPLFGYTHKTPSEANSDASPSPLPLHPQRATNYGITATPRSADPFLPGTPRSPAELAQARSTEMGSSHGPPHSETDGTAPPLAARALALQGDMLEKSNSRWRMGSDGDAAPPVSRGPAVGSTDGGVRSVDGLSGIVLETDHWDESLPPPYEMPGHHQLDTR